MSTDHSYPGIPDWERYVLDYVPAVARAGDGTPWVLGLSRPFADLELQIEGIVREMADLEVAGRSVLEAKGALYGVEAGGVGLEELRRLVIGARAGMASVGSDDSLYRMWTAITGSTDVKVGTIGVTAKSVRLEARIAFEPSAAWLRAAGRIVDRAVEAGMDWSALVHVGGVLRWGTAPPGWGVGTWAYPLVRP